MTVSTIKISPDGPKIKMVHEHLLTIRYFHCSACELEKCFFEAMDAEVFRQKHIEEVHFGNPMVCQHREVDRISFESPVTGTTYWICENCGQTVPGYGEIPEIVK